MKKILFSVYILLLPFFAVCQLLSKPIKIDKSLQKIIDQANNNASLKLPYGDKNIFHQYSPVWQNYNASKTQENSNAESFVLDSLIGQLDNFFYTDIDAENRKKGEVSYIKNKFLFIPNFKVSDSIKKYNRNIEITCAKLFQQKEFTTYSIIFSGNKDCNNCEFKVKQTQNILVNVNNENKIIDKLLIGNIEGNDLGRYRMYFYIDEKKKIHLKDFSSDELEDGFLHYRKYQILSNGIFKKYYLKNSS